MEYIKILSGCIGVGMVIYYTNDIKNVKRYPGYQNTYKGLDTHLTGIFTGLSIITLSLIIKND